jgi:hypothetical protein
MSSLDKATEEVKRTALSYATEWGSKFSIHQLCRYESSTVEASWNHSLLTVNVTESPLPSTLLATLITALHARPFQPLPMIFPPVLLLSTYLNLNNYAVDSAGITAAWSGLYLLLASRRKGIGKTFTARLGSRFGARGLTRGTAMALAGANLVGGGITYATGKQSKEAEKK